MPTVNDNDTVTMLVAAAIFAPSPTELLARAATLARSTTHRQLVAIASAHIAGDADRVRVLAADHAVDHPDDVLVAWMAGAASPTTATTAKDPS